jgi:hypothetical protein
LSELKSKEEEIIRIKQLVYSSKEPDIQMNAIDALAAYGRLAIEALNEVIKCPSINGEVKKQELKTIEDIEKNLSVDQPT